MEEPQPAEEQEQQPNDAEPTTSLDGDEVEAKSESGGKAAADSPEIESGGFDADMFASLMQQELIAYNVSWDPLMKVLQALGASMAKQQQAQKSASDSVGEVETQVNALRNELARVEGDKSEMASAMEKMQGQVADIQSQLDQMQAQQPQESQQQAGGDGENIKEEASAEGGAKAAKNNTLPQPFVTAHELAEAKKELSKEMERALAHALGHTVDDDDIKADGEDKDMTRSSSGEPGSGADGIDGSNEGDEYGDGTGDATGRSTSSTASTPRKATTGFKLPGVPYASDAKLQEELAKLHELQDALKEKMAEHDQRLDAMQSDLGKWEELAPQLSGASNASSPAVPSTGNHKSTDGEGVGVDTSALMKDVKELRAQQEVHDQKLRDHDDVMEKHTTDIKSLADSLDDFNVQQQTMASMYASPTVGTGDAEEEGGSGKDGSNGESAGSGSGKTGKSGKPGGKSMDATSQPQLDLSLVFTKLADLRRTTDASLSTLKDSIKGVSGTTQSQQDQLDALRNGMLFNEHLQVYLVESRLAMQKELLSRNQAFQERTKPQLAEWRKALELNEDKLLQGHCDEETLRALQQLQRYYHRTLLSITPLVNSPLSIAETMQTLSDEVKQLQNAIQAGVVPLRVSDGSGVGVEGEDGDQTSKDEREEEYARKLRYLDEEIDATLQVNISTEKKNDPLIKALDAMREKLEALWLRWHRNYNDQKSGTNGARSINEDGNTNIDGNNSLRGASGSSSGREFHDGHRDGKQQDATSDALREVELRLSGAIRRLGMVEEDIERLNSATALHSAEFANDAADTDSSGGVTMMANRRGSSIHNLRTGNAMEELDKLRKEMYAEIAKIMVLLPGGGGNGRSSNNNGSNSSLVPIDRRSMASTTSMQGDVLTDLYTQVTGRELDQRFQDNTPEGQKQFYDSFLKEVTKKVSHALADKGMGGHRAPAGPGVGGTTNANTNYRLLLDNFAQKVDDRLEDAREFTAEEMARLRKELMEHLKMRFEVALRDLRGELMLFAPIDGDSTAMGTKPVMCVACSRPVPVSNLVREAGSLPPAELSNPEPIQPAQPPEYEYDRPDDDFVFRAGFKMPAHDRKIMTLPFLTNTMRSKVVLNKPEGKRKRPARQAHLNSSNRVDNVIREAMELDRASRGRGHDLHPQ